MLLSMSGGDKDHERWTTAEGCPEKPTQFRRAAPASSAEYKTYNEIHEFAARGI
jgi:hypothetical protein